MGERDQLKIGNMDARFLYRGAMPGDGMGSMSFDILLGLGCQGILTDCHVTLFIVFYSSSFNRNPQSAALARVLRVQTTVLYFILRSDKQNFEGTYQIPLNTALFFKNS